MKYLLDASALVPLVTKHGRQLLERTRKDWIATTDLAIYEACNSVWKMTHLLHSVSVEHGMEIINVIGELVEREVLHLQSISELELSSTLGLAVDRGLTYYDASYVTTANRLGATLVTQDDELAHVAREQVEVLSCKDVEASFSRSES